MSNPREITSLRRPKQRGNAIIEAALLMPWIFFLFAGVTDFGLYVYGAICTQNAARAGAMAASVDAFSALPSVACPPAVAELKVMINMAGIACPVAASPGAVTSALPLAVVVNQLSCTSPTKCADCTAATCAEAALPLSAQVTVTYQNIGWIAIPGLSNALTLSRTTEMRVIQ